MEGKIKKIILAFIMISCIKNSQVLENIYKDINEDLVEAVILGKHEDIKNLIEKGADPNYVFKNSKIISWNKDQNMIERIDCFRILVEKSMNLNKESISKIYELAFNYLTHVFSQVKIRAKDLIILLKSKNYKCESEKENITVYFLFLCYESNANSLEKFIKENKIDPLTFCDKNHLNPLIIAAANENLDVIKILIEKYNLKVDKTGVYGWGTAFTIACELGNKKTAEYLIEKGADINKKIASEYNCLRAAIRSGNSELLKLILKVGNFSNNNLIVEAFLLENDEKQILEFLINKFNSSSESYIFRYCLLFLSLRLSIINNDLDAAKLAIQNGANVNTIWGNTKKNSFLSKSIEYGNKEIIKLLVEKGADVNKKNEVGKSALIQAIDKDYRDIAKILIENFCDIEGVELKGLLEETLIDNIKKQNMEICLFLINSHRNKINFNFKDSEGNTFLHYVAAIQNYKLLNLLLNYKCEINEPNSKGETPLYFAISKDNFDQEFVLYLINSRAVLKSCSYIREKALIDILMPFESICERLVYNPLINNINNTDISLETRNLLKEIIRKLKLKEIDFDENKEMINFIRNVLFLNENLDLDLNSIVISNMNNQDVELNIEVFDEIFRHFEDEDYWDSIVKKAVDYVKDSYIKDLDQISLEYLECVKNKGLEYAKSTFNLDIDKKLGINKLVKEKINFIKSIFKDKLQRLQTIEPINKSLLEMNQKEREQNTDFQRKKQLSKLLKIISLMAVQGNNYDKIKFSINQILDIMVCREGSLEALNEAIRYVSSEEIQEVDQSVKSILDEELMKLRYELFKEVVNQQINENKIKLNILIDGRKIQIKAEMVPELLPSLLKTMHDDLKIKLEYLDSDDNYNFIYDREYIIEEVKRRYKERIINYVRDKMEDSRALWTKVRDYIERNIFEGRAILQIEEFIYDEDYRIKRESIIALLLHLNYLNK